MEGHWSGNFKSIRLYFFLFLLIILPLILMAVPVDWNQYLPDLCLYKNLTGKECWGCGTSRAIVSVLHFDFLSAWEYNKTIIITFPLLCYVWGKWIYLICKELRNISRIKREKTLHKQNN